MLWSLKINRSTADNSSTYNKKKKWKIKEHVQIKSKKTCFPETKNPSNRPSLEETCEGRLGNATREVPSRYPAQEPVTSYRSREGQTMGGLQCGRHTWGTTIS
jgi:hypothetical protein